MDIKFACCIGLVAGVASGVLLVFFDLAKEVVLLWALARAVKRSRMTQASR